MPDALVFFISVQTSSSVLAGVCCRPVASRCHSASRRELLLGGMGHLQVIELQQHTGDNVFEQRKLRSTKLRVNLSALRVVQSKGCCKL